MQRFRKPQWILFLLLAISAAQVFAQATNAVDWQAADAARNAAVEAEAEGRSSSGSATDVPDLHDLVDGLDLDLSKSPLSTQEQDVANAISERVKATEWLGALGPVAVSPFFGLTCLSGIAIVGEDRLPEDHYLRRASTPLRHPLVFITFLALTILTSIPKFSKVSKPFAQAVDQLETYSAIVILLIIRFMGGIELGPPGEQEVAVVYQAGIFEFTAETLLMLATIVNIVVINTVKFFFEVMIWITPVPFIDAIFEAANKTFCAGLAAVYAFSPTAATVINLLILAACLLAFNWVKRREIYYRTVLFDFVRHWWSPNSELAPDGKIVVFPKMEFEGIPPMSKCELSKNSDGWVLEARRWFRPAIVRRWTDRAPSIKSGLLMNKMQIGNCEFRFGKRYNTQFSELAARLGATYDGTESVQRPSGSLATEFT